MPRQKIKSPAFQLEAGRVQVANLRQQLDAEEATLTAEKNAARIDRDGGIDIYDSQTTYAQRLVVAKRQLTAEQTAASNQRHIERVVPAEAAVSRARAALAEAKRELAPLEAAYKADNLPALTAEAIQRVATLQNQIIERTTHQQGLTATQARVQRICDDRLATQARNEAAQAQALIHGQPLPEPEVLPKMPVEDQNALGVAIQAVQGQIRGLERDLRQTRAEVVDLEKLKADKICAEFIAEIKALAEMRGFSVRAVRDGLNAAAGPSLREQMIFDSESRLLAQNQQLKSQVQELQAKVEGLKISADYRSGKPVSGSMLAAAVGHMSSISVDHSEILRRVQR